MVSPRANRIYIAAIIIGGIAALVPLVFIILTGRASFISFLLQHLQRSYLSNILSEKIITEKKYALLTRISWSLIPADALLVVCLLYFRRKVTGFLKFFAASFYAAFRSLVLVFRKSSRTENIIVGALLAAIMLRGVYYILTTDLQYDEMWCYNYYTSRPFYLTVFSYANYPLYELSTHVFKWLPFSEKINLRLPALLGGLCSCVIIYACARKISGDFITPLASMLLFAVMPFATQYMLYGKGVSLEIFFAASSFFCLLFYAKGLFSRRYLLLYVIANVCGIYAMPTHLYCWILLLTGGIIYFSVWKKGLLKKFLLANLLVAGLGLFCYLPVILGSGISFVTDAAWGHDFAAELFPENGSLERLINLYFTGSQYGFLAALLLAVVALVAGKKYGRDNFFLLACGAALVILPLAIRLVQHIHIPERSIGFIGLAIPLFVFFVFYGLKDGANAYLRAGSLTILAGAMVLVSHFHPFRFWSAKYDQHAVEISNLLMEHRVSNCYDNAPSSEFFYYYPALEFYYRQKKMNIDLFTAAPKSLRYKRFSGADDYDCIVQSLGSSDSVYRNAYRVIYADEHERFRLLLKNGK